MIYLLHFHRKFGHARHYLGFCANEENLIARMERHRRGDGSRLVRAVSAAGIRWKCVRVWPSGTRTEERKLKNRRNASQLCPVCRGEASYARAHDHAGGAGHRKVSIPPQPPRAPRALRQATSGPDAEFEGEVCDEECIPF